MRILETKRLELRRLKREDMDALYALYRDPEIRRYFPEGTLDEEQTREELEWFLNGHPEHPELGLWATIDKASGAFIGRCGLLPWTIDGQKEVEVAYLIDKRYWRQGLASEAAQAIADYAFDVLRLERVICMIDAENQGSIGVATKIGMRFEREAVDETGPFQLYSLEGEPRPLSEIVTLRELTHDTFSAICDLKVRPDQEMYVAPNVYSIAEASFTPKSWMRGIYAGEVPVGFMMLYDDPDTPEYYLWRFMIDARFQGKGYGREALQLLFEYVRGRPQGDAVTLSYAPGPHSPLGFYQVIGFEETGQEHDGEREMRRAI